MKSLYADGMERLRRPLDALEAGIVPWLARYSITILRVGLSTSNLIVKLDGPQQT